MACLAAAGWDEYGNMAWRRLAEVAVNWTAAAPKISYG